MISCTDDIALYSIHLACAMEQLLAKLHFMHSHLEYIGQNKMRNYQELFFMTHYFGSVSITLIIIYCANNIILMMNGGLYELQMKN